MMISICLLSDTPWGDFPTWVQAGCAMITLMLIVMGLLQNRRIQELVDIVKELKNKTTELKNQSDILTKRYELELHLSLKSRIPYFEKRYFYATAASRHTFSIKNTGLDGFSLTVRDLVYDKILISKLDYSENGDVPSGKPFDIDFYTNRDWVDSKMLTFSFSLEFYDGLGNKFLQVVNCEAGLPTVNMPALKKEQI